VEFDPLSRRVIGCAIEVHRELGPGLLESTYSHCLAYELDRAAIAYRLEWPVPLEYKGNHLDCGYRIDLLVEGTLVVELKATDSISKVHEAQILTYMKLAAMHVGLLMNFNVTMLKDGIRRFVL